MRPPRPETARPPAALVSRSAGARRGVPFGPYWLLERIGRGGMAEVFRADARDAIPGAAPVVIKRLLRRFAALPEHQAMFADEARITSLLHHPNIVRFVDCGRAEGICYIVLEHLDGQTLARLVRQLDRQGRRLPLGGAAHVACEGARAPAYRHRAAGADGRP